MTLTLGELQKETGVPMHALRRLANRGHIPAKRPPGGFWRVHESALPEIKRMLEDFGLMEPAKANERKRK